MNNNEWLDIDVLEDYLDGKLDTKTMHRVERLSLEDPFVAEALAGLSLSPKRVQSLSLLQKQLQDRIAQKPVEQKRWQITSQRLSIAAAAAVLFVTVSLLFWMREKSNREQLAANTPKKVEVAIAPIQVPEKPKVEVDKIIAEAKTNTYASRSRKVSPQPQVAALALTQEAQPLQSEQKKEISTNRISSTLEGRVAGMRVNGVVYDENKSPIPGVSVKLKGSSYGTATNLKGEFNLAIDSIVKDPKLTLGYLGFMPKEVSAKTGENLAVELKQNNAALNEVVIVGYGSQKKQMSVGSITSVKINGGTAEPVWGWDKFEEYVVNNNKLLKDKKLTGRYVIVSFKVNESAEPIDVKVEKNASMIPQQTEAEEKEAIRLVKEGPKWNLPYTGGAFTVKIKF